MLDALAPFADLTTPHVADACIRLGIPVRCAPSSMRPVFAGTHAVGRVLPAQHTGSVDVFLEAMEGAQPGDVLVVDDGGNVDEACVGDLITLEAAKAELSAVVIWGLHRDTPELVSIGLPVVSLGSSPTGPLEVRPGPADALTQARVGTHVITSADFVLVDDDGAVFLPIDRATELAELAATIRDTERSQAALMHAGTTLRQQMRFTDYLQVRAENGTGFREHLRSLGGAIEE